MLHVTVPMQTPHAFLATLILASGLLAGHLAQAGARATENFDANWRFLRVDAPGAEQPEFADGQWRKLDVPHDWSIEGPFAATNQTGGAGGFLPGGVGWYRKHFLLPENFSRGRVFIEFDGVMANSDVWINGFHLGRRPYGYTSFGYDLTGHLNFGGEENIIAVRADNSAQPASRWFTGAGIYRHVRLIATDDVHIVKNGVFISTPEISTTNAVVRVETLVTNATDSSCEIRVLAAISGPPHSAPDGSYGCSGESQPVSVPAGKSVRVTFDVKIPWKPRLWDLEHPDLHKAWVRVRSASQTIDEATVTFGIREAKFESDTGFWLNGKNLKLKGVCLHHDGGAFGAAVPLGVWEQRLAALKKLGANAIRTAHNPPAPEFLDLCDRMGFLVMDEFFDCWTVAKNPYDYHLYFDAWSKTDERDAILRDRNHPSVIIYSVGNEIHDTPKAELAKGILKGLVEVAHEADPTRPVTQGLFRPNVSGDYTNGLADLLDVVGQNYREKEILAAHEQKPLRKILGTENTHDRNQWVAMRDHAPYAGQFLWTGIDYLGEARNWPAIGHGSGLLDRTGEIRPLAGERQSWWSKEPMVRIVRRVAPTERMPTDPGYGMEERHTQVLFADWTPKNPLPHDENVEVYSNAREVELFLNGQSLGSKPLNADASPRIWKIPFAAGKLKAVARNEGKIVATDELRTAGAPAKIALATDGGKLTPDWNSIARVTVTIVDKNGVVVPGADDLITFKISGPGVIAAVDNGGNASHEPFQAGERHALQGRCVAFVKATAPSGKITLTASAPGLIPGSVVIKTAEAVSAE
jgi:beta-galactosidase